MTRVLTGRSKRSRSSSPAPIPPPAPSVSPPPQPQSPHSNAGSLISPPVSFPSQLPPPPSPPSSPSLPCPSLSAAARSSSALPSSPPSLSAAVVSPVKSSGSLLIDPFPDWHGRFEVIERLGYGSFASVWLARDSQRPPSHPHHTVALKRIRPLSSAQRIYDEARFLEQLDGQHHCCELLEILLDMDDPRCHPTLVLAYMPHSSYKTYLPLLTLAHVQQYMRALLEALTHLAAQPTPILHRDLKPANFLVQWPPTEECVERWLRDRTDVSGGFRLVDFGLAHAQHKHADKSRAHAREQQNKRRKHDSDSTLTASLPHTAQAAAASTSLAARSLPVLRKSSTLGTRGFRAPEILLRHPRQQLCCASDVWNAGVIFLSLLTQRYPILDRSDSEEALVQLMALIGPQTHMGDTNITLHNLNLQRAAEDAHIFASPSTAASADGGKDMQFPTLDEYCWLSTERHWPVEAFELLRGLLAFDPHDRLTAQQALNHPFLSIDYDVQDETYTKRVELAERNEVQWTERKRTRDERWRENERQKRLSLEKENHTLSSSAINLYRRHNWQQSPLHQLYSRGRGEVSSRGASVGLLSGSGWNSRAELSLPPSQPYRPLRIVPERANDNELTRWNGVMVAERADSSDSSASSAEQPTQPTPTINALSPPHRHIERSYRIGTV